jgi:hypothetical protein
MDDEAPSQPAGLADGSASARVPRPLASPVETGFRLALLVGRAVPSARSLAGPPIRPERFLGLRTHVLEGQRSAPRRPPLAGRRPPRRRPGRCLRHARGRLGPARPPRRRRAPPPPPPPPPAVCGAAPGRGVSSAPPLRHAPRAAGRAPAPARAGARGTLGRTDPPTAVRCRRRARALGWQPQRQRAAPTGGSPGPATTTSRPDGRLV